MAYKVKIYPAARQDLSDIVDYLNTLSQDTALKYYDLLTEEILSLREMPERCPRPRDLALAAKGYRYLKATIWFSMWCPEIRYRSEGSCMAAGIISCYCKDSAPVFAGAASFTLSQKTR